MDFYLSPKDSMHINFQYTHSWFQTPNDYENQAERNRAARLLYYAFDLVMTLASLRELRPATT